MPALSYQRRQVVYDRFRPDTTYQRQSDHSGIFSRRNSNTADMIENLKINDYGLFHFTLRKKGMTERMGFELCATVVEIDMNFILLRDNDDIEYLPRKTDIDYYKPILQGVAG